MNKYQLTIAFESPEISTTMIVDFVRDALLAEEPHEYINRPTLTITPERPSVLESAFRCEYSTKEGRVHGRLFAKRILIGDFVMSQEEFQEFITIPHINFTKGPSR